MNDWPTYIREGRQYLKTATNGRKRSKVFSNELIYNLIGLSVEKLLVGLCLHRDHLPAAHSLSGIINAVQRLCPMDTALAEEIRMMDRIRDLCALDVHARCEVNDRQIECLLAMNHALDAYVNNNLTPPTSCGTHDLTAE